MLQPSLDWNEWESTMLEKTKEHLWVCDGDVGILIQKHRDFLIVQEETEEVRWVEGLSSERQPKPTLSSFEGWNDSLLTALCCLSAFFISSFTHFRSFRPERITLTYKASTLKCPYSLTRQLRRTNDALTSPWLKKKHNVVTTPPSRLPLERPKQM